MEKSKIFIPYVVLFLMIATFSACGSKAKNEGSAEVINTDFRVAFRSNVRQGALL
jgi:hypothetical protein